MVSSEGQAVLPWIPQGIYMLLIQGMTAYRSLTEMENLLQCWVPAELERVISETREMLPLTLMEMFM